MSAIHLIFLWACAIELTVKIVLQNLTHMGLTFLPQEVFVLSCLTVLDVKENDITFLPETIGWLSKLVQLDVSVRMFTTHTHTYTHTHTHTHTCVCARARASLRVYSTLNM